MGRGVNALHGSRCGRLDVEELDVSMKKIQKSYIVI